jgi:hypothetical protein
MTTYRVLVTGSRDWRHPETIRRALDHAHNTMLYTFDENATFVVVHGVARGADTTAHLHADSCNWTTKPHPADWTHLGKRAGMIRNTEMVADGAQTCLAFIRNHSRGATACAAMAERAGIPTLRFHDCPCHGGDAT